MVSQGNGINSSPKPYELHCDEFEAGLTAIVSSFYKKFDFRNTIFAWLAQKNWLMVPLSLFLASETIFETVQQVLFLSFSDFTMPS